MPECAAPGCTTKARAKTTMGGPGLCTTHETRLRRFGDVGQVSEDGANGLYADRGCSLSPSCLRCHLPMCRYDMTPGEVMALEREMSAR